jgi:hypothetical protein
MQRSADKVETIMGTSAAMKGAWGLHSDESVWDLEKRWECKRKKRSFTASL